MVTIFHFLAVSGRNGTALALNTAPHFLRLERIARYLLPIFRRGAKNLLIVYAVETAEKCQLSHLQIFHRIAVARLCHRPMPLKLALQFGNVCRHAEIAPYADNQL
jgi:hypothetical protein